MKVFMKAFECITKGDYSKGLMKAYSLVIS